MKHELFSHWGRRTGPEKRADWFRKSLRTPATPRKNPPLVKNPLPTGCKPMSKEKRQAARAAIKDMLSIYEGK